MTSTPKVASPLKGALDGALVVSCDEVARYFYQGTDQEHWDMPDFPNIAPPFERFWLDFSAPEKTVSVETGEQMWSGMAPSDWGFFCLGTQLSSENEQSYLLQQPWRRSAGFFAKHLSQAKWGLDLCLIWQRLGQIEGPLWTWRLLVNEQGEVVRNAQGQTAIAEGAANETMSKLIDQAVAVSESSQAGRQVVYDIVLPFFHTAMLSLSFLHCRNIELKDVTPPVKTVHKKAQKRRGETSYKPVPYKVLNIQPMRQVLHTEGKSDTVGTKQSLHICRGHFKHYESGRGLFGKLHGTYWWPMQVRGSKEKGVATKDYRIEL